MNRLTEILTGLLSSQRVQLFLAGLLVTFFTKVAPGVALSETDSLKIVGLIVALIVSQVMRPLDPTKPSPPPTQPENPIPNPLPPVPARPGIPDWLKVILGGLIGGGAVVGVEKVTETVPAVAPQPGATEPPTEKPTEKPEPGTGFFGGDA